MHTVHSFYLIHTVHSSSAFAEVPLHFFITDQLGGKNLNRVPSRVLNSGMPYKYNKQTHYQLSYAAPYWATPHPDWATPRLVYSQHFFCLQGLGDSDSDEDAEKWVQKQKSKVEVRSASWYKPLERLLDKFLYRGFLKISSMTFLVYYRRFVQWPCASVWATSTISTSYHAFTLLEGSSLFDECPKVLPVCTVFW